MRAVHLLGDLPDPPVPIRHVVSASSEADSGALQPGANEARQATAPVYVGRKPSSSEAYGTAPEFRKVPFRRLLAFFVHQRRNDRV